MRDAALDRWLLVNYAGYPFGPNSLMPDNGLANLAASLLADGRAVRVEDCATVSLMAEFTSPELTSRLAQAWDRLMPSGPGARAPDAPERARLLRCLEQGEEERTALQQALLRRLADELERRIREGRIQAVGFKLWNGDGLLGAAFLAEEIRRRCPAVRVFGGGPHVDIFMERLLEAHDVFDALAFGECEETIRRLGESGADARSYASIPNLIFRADGAIRRSGHEMIRDLDRLPMPVYDPEVYPAMAGDEKIRIIVVDESRGCRNNCAFCIHPVKSNHTLRTKSVAKLIAEIGNIAARYRIRTFRFAGSCTPYELLNAFAAAARGGQPWAYSSFAHLRNSAEADFEAMAASGCVSLFFGIESGSPAVLKKMRKGISLPDVVPTIRRAAAAGIFPVGSIIYPAPGETEESEQDTLALLAEARPGAVTVQAPLVVPMTDWFDSPQRYGVALEKAGYLREIMHWKAKLLMPPSFWSPLPVSIDGRDFKAILGKTSEFVARVEAMGIPTAMADDTYLMSRAAGMDVVEFRDRTRRAFFAGDMEPIRALVAGINANV
ncbi:MAG: B12-binding domain-containing radical SAM protein [Lentisphaerae bacterium]|nr:B12-binding domain-containing radical SAM protein [Lentisphaerota bacterium]